MRRFNFQHLWWSGGLSNQPDFYMREIHCVLDAEIEFQNEKVNAQKFIANLKKSLQK